MTTTSTAAPFEYRVPDNSGADADEVTPLVSAEKEFLSEADGSSVSDAAGVTVSVGAVVAVAVALIVVIAFVAHRRRKALAERIRSQGEGFMDDELPSFIVVEEETVAPELCMGWDSTVLTLPAARTKIAV